MTQALGDVLDHREDIQWVAIGIADERVSTIGPDRLAVLAEVRLSIRRWFPAPAIGSSTCARKSGASSERELPE
jgi:hypothetical protein